MNNKGFTLVEVLAVVVILGIVLGIASYGVLGTIDTSKIRSEQIFVERLSKLIDEYIDLESSKLEVVGDAEIFNKCGDESCSSDKQYSVKAWKVRKKCSETGGCDVTLNDLVDVGLVEKNEIKNPRNKLLCLENDKNPEVIIYKDSEYVYYYYVDLRDEKTSCGIEENGIINTFPSSLSSKLGF